MKRIKNLQIGLIAMAFIITAAFLFGGQVLTTKLRVQDPLKRDLHGVKEVQRYALEQKKDGIEVSLKLRKVENLQRVLEQVQQKIQRYYDKPVTAIKIIDHRSRYLEQVRYQLSFYFEEALISGHYIRLKDALDSYGGIKAKVYFSQNYLYVQLEQGSHYLYEALPSSTVNRNLANNNQGGDSTG